jgi:hypothetical protein
LEQRWFRDSTSFSVPVASFLYLAIKGIVAPSSNSLTTAFTEFSLILSVEEMSFITEIVVENEKLKLALQR